LKEESKAATLVVISLSGSNEDVKVSVRITCLGEVDDDAEYSFEFVMSSIVFTMLLLVVLAI
jgi:hypothetical protein